MDLETISAPGVYDISADSYHADPCPEPSLSGSVIKVIAGKSPRHAWACHPRLNAECESVEKASFDLGDAFHKLILEKGRELFPLDFPDFRSGDAKKARDGAREAGFTPLLRSQFDRAIAMAQAAKAQVPQWEELALAMSHGIPERTYIWQEETPFGPVWCRCMVDWSASHGNLHPDWKSTEVGAGPDEWGAKTLWNLDYHIQAAWNARALRKAGAQHPELFFAVVETKFPHALACMKPSKVAIAMADRDIERAIVTWAWCLKNNRWPGYRNQLAWVDPPAWKERGFLEREERNELDPETIIANLKAAADARTALAMIESPRDDLDAFGLEPLK
jgi:hypothetical protein